MDKHGGVSGWYFLPWVSCGGQIPWNKLYLLEQTKIADHPNSLNKMRSKYAPLKPPPSLGDGRDVPYFPSKKSESVSSKTVKPMVQYIKNGSIIQGIASLTEALAISDCVAWHSYYPWSVLAAERRWSRSKVLLIGSSGEIFHGSLRLGFRTIRHWEAGYRLLIITDRQEHVLARPHDYEYLLACCRGEVDRHEAEELLAADLWRMWGISERECSMSIHAKNKKFIARQLQWRGITLRPDSRFKVKLPAGCNATKDDVVKVLRATLKKSYLPLCICDHILETVQVVTYASDTLAELLDNGRGWSNRINDGEVIE